jgi:hypothetical protein
VIKKLREPEQRNRERSWEVGHIYIKGGEVIHGSALPLTGICVKIVAFQYYELVNLYMYIL